jgi:CRISPR-associated protein Cmr6
MRDTLRGVAADSETAHFALAYDAGAPTGTGGKFPEQQKWIEPLAQRSVAGDYAKAFERWKKSFGAGVDRVFSLRAVSRLLVGHGTDSATDVGLTVHHTWGVPMIAGSALKGLCAHYLDAVYGPDDPTVPAWRQSDRVRAPFQGVRRAEDNGFPLSGPGDAFRAIFGAPDAYDDETAQRNGAAATSSGGLVTFHDALYIPGSAPSERPFVPDVLTVHQQGYYRDAGATGWPNDFDEPIPVSFLTVRPGVELLFVLTAPPAWGGIAEQILKEALREWGVGGKTSSGYGRFESQVPQRNLSQRAQQLRFVAGDVVRVSRIEDPTGRGRMWFQAPDGFSGTIVGGDAPRIDIGQTADLEIASVLQPARYNFRLPRKRVDDGPRAGRRQRREEST